MDNRLSADKRIWFNCPICRDRHLVMWFEIHMRKVHKIEVAVTNLTMHSMETRCRLCGELLPGDAGFTEHVRALALAGQLELHVVKGMLVGEP